MEISSSDYRLIPFGIDRWSADDIAVSRDADGRFRVSSPFPCAAIDRERNVPLRLNNSDYDLAFRPADEVEPDLVAVLRDCIKLECDPWNRKALAFIDGFFDALERMVVADEGAIARAAVGFGRLFEPRDWIFSAPRPLPRAHISVPGRDGDSNSDYLPVDFAFWTGWKLVALDLGTGTMMPAAARDRERRLRDANIELIASAPSNDGEWTDFLAGLAPPASTFWEGETLPLGPFRSKALDTLVAT